MPQTEDCEKSLIARSERSLCDPRCLSWFLNKSEHSRPRKFLASIPPLKQAKHSSSGAWQTIKRADSAGTSIANDVRVNFRRSDVAVPEYFLNSPNVTTRS